MSLVVAAAGSAIGGGSMVHWFDFNWGLHRLAVAAVPWTTITLSLSLNYNYRPISNCYGHLATTDWCFLVCRK